MKTSFIAASVVLGLSLCACSKSESSAGKDAPAAPAATTHAADTKKAEEKPAAPAMPTAAPGAGADAPTFTEGNSAPPTVAEWSSAPSVNTVGANSAPKDCFMKNVREWLKIQCTGNIKEVTNMEGFGKKNFDYFESIKPGTMADFVVRVKKGSSIKARILREGGGASLFVNWPAAQPKPTIVALQTYSG